MGDDTSLADGCSSIITGEGNCNRSGEISGVLRWGGTGDMMPTGGAAVCTGSSCSFPFPTTGVEGVVVGGGRRNTGGCW